MGGWDSTDAAVWADFVLVPAQGRDFGSGVERRGQEIDLAAGLRHGKPGLGLLQEPNDLFLCGLAFPHVRHSPGQQAANGWDG